MEVGPYPVPDYKRSGHSSRKDLLVIKSCVHTSGWLSSKVKADIQAMLSFCLGLKSLRNQTVSPVQSNDPRSVGQSSPPLPIPTQGM